ncbi:helix-turn-helix transcriptional regulator, partial [Enterobacter sp. 63]
VRDALRGVKRFGEFQKSLGIAKNMLTARLKLLVEEGILTLQPASDGSAWQEYVLTDKGRALQTVLVALSQWGNEFLFSPNQPGSVLVDIKNQQPLRKLALVANDGRELAPQDIELKLP